MAHIDDCKEKCCECGKLLDSTVEFTNISHTDVYYCDLCLYGHRLERSKREDSQLIIIKFVGEEIRRREDNVIEEMMRCSEQHGNMLREVQ